jgi:hypothetical protein
VSFAVPGYEALPALITKTIPSAKTERNGRERQQHVDCCIRAAKLAVPDREIANSPIVERDSIRAPLMR